MHIKYQIKLFVWLVAIGVVSSISSPLYAQIPPPTAVPIDGVSGAVAVIAVGVGLAIRKYRKR